MNYMEHQALVQEIEDAKAYGSEDVKWAPPSAWYAVRTAPGAQRSPSIMDELPDRREGKYLSLIERNLDRAGIEHFMPSFRRDVIHHRTKKWIDRRFPVFIGYCFVNLPKQNFAKVEEVDGVIGFVRSSCTSPNGKDVHLAPALFPEGIIGKLRFVEFEMEQDLRRGRISRLQDQSDLERMKGSRPTRSELNAFFTKGRRLHLNRQSPVADLPARVLSITSRGAIRAVVETLTGERREDIPLAHIEQIG